MSETSSIIDHQLYLIEYENENVALLANPDKDSEDEEAPAKQEEQHLSLWIDELEKPAISPEEQEALKEAAENAEKLRLIKARTMFDMVEEVEDGATRILFLTNSQASLLANDERSLSNLFSALEIGKPSLVINLLMSFGFSEGVCLWSPPDIADMWRELAGVLGGTAPFLSLDEEASAESRIDMFMTEVLIPLAAKTNALVLCDAVSRKCFLSRSFMRMCKVAAARWGNKLPFTILSVVSDVIGLYRNTDTECHWRRLRAQCRAWRQRDAKIQEVALRGSAGDRDGRHDIDVNATLLLAADCIDPVKDKVDSEAMTRLRAALVAHLGGSVPTLSIKTGMALKARLNQKSAVTMQRASDLAQNEQIVLFLDVRPRAADQFGMAKSAFRFSDDAKNPNPLLSSMNQGFDSKPKAPVIKRTREELIAYAKKHLTEWCDQLLEKGCAETLDCCSLAFMHDCLVGDGTPKNEGLGEAPTEKGTALHDAIRMTKSGQIGKKDDVDWRLARPATREEVASAAEWLTHRIFSDAWQILENREEQEAKGHTYRTLWKNELLAQNIYMRMLLSSPSFFHANLYDMAGCGRLVNKLVCKDRLPAGNPIEGLLLLRSAWDDYDVVMRLAGRYKILCKMLFAAQLLLGLLVVLGFLWSEWYRDSENDEDTANTLVQAAFGVTLGITFLVTLDGQFNPKNRWRQLRSCAGTLQSSIWQYRTRVGLFELDEKNQDSSDAEVALCRHLNEWRDSMISSAGLKETALKRAYPAKTYRHKQHEGVLEEGDDDHQSPTQPTRYIALRVDVAMAFYRTRIPIYNRRLLLFRGSVALLGVAASLLAHYKAPMWVAMVTALAGTVMSWAEFSDAGSKVERYSKALTALEKVLSWWDSLTVVQKAGKESITKLVIACESIISDEMLSWTTAGVKPKDDKEKKEKDGENSGNAVGA